MFVNLIRFEILSSFGDGSYVNATWSRILKFINMKEFDYGLIACTGGKYKQDTQISAIFEEVECPVWKNYEGMTKRDFVANLWELKGQGVVGDDEFVYGCLNEECADSLKSGLAGSSMLLLAMLFGLIVVSTFTIGLAANTLKFDIHYKTIATNVLLLLLQAGVIFVAVYFTYKAEFKALEVS